MCDERNHGVQRYNLLASPRHEIQPRCMASNTSQRKAQSIILAAKAIPPRHPEEVAAEVQLRIGRDVSLSIAAQATPAGLVATGVLVSLILLSVAPVIWAARRSR